MALKLTTEIIDDLPDEKALEILEDLMVKDFAMTLKYYPEKGGLDLIDAPYFPGVAGQIYLTDGLDGLRKFSLNTTGIKEALKLYLKLEQSYLEILEKDELTEGEMTEIISIKLNDAKIIRNTMKIVRSNGDE